MTSTSRFRGLASLALALVLGAAGTASAQSSLQAPIQFDFLNPGARSLGLGSAFVGLADDATAAYVNPAGLTQLARPEVSIEGRFSHSSQPFLVGGRLSGTPTNQGIDTVKGAQYQSITDSLGSVGFASFVYSNGKGAIAAYRHQLLDLDQDFSSTGVFQNHGTENRDTPFTAHRDLTIANYGVSAGYRLTPMLSIGGGLSIYKFSYGFTFNRSFFSGPGIYGAPDPSQVLLKFNQTGDDTGIGGNVGILADVTKTVRVGAAFKRGASFDFTTTSGGPVGTGLTTTGKFKVPDVFSVGGVVRPTDVLMVTVEYDRVQQSQLLDNYVLILVGQGESASRASNFTIDDSNQIHVGAEYTLTSVRYSPSLRAGLWSDPDHSVHYTPTAANDLLDERIVAALSSGKDLWHYTFGVGVPFSPRMEFNLGGDVTSRSTIISASAILRF